MRPGGGPMPNFFMSMVQQGQQGQRRGGRRAAVPGQQNQQQPVPLMQQQMLPRGRVYRYPPGRNVPDVSMGGMGGGGMGSVPYDIGNGMQLRDAGISQPIPIGALASALANASPTEQRTMFLQENMQTKANNRCGFIYPASIYGDLCQRNVDLVISNIAHVISHNTELCFFLAPYLQRAVMRYHEEGGPCETDKSRPFRWEFSNCNQQESGWECGYYVMYFMFHFASHQQSIFPKRVLWNDPTPLTKRTLDDIAMDYPLFECLSETSG